MYWVKNALIKPLSPFSIFQAFYLEADKYLFQLTDYIFLDNIVFGTLAGFIQIMLD